MTDTRVEHERQVALLRPSNMRELGGLPAANGRTVRRGALFRAGGLHHLRGDDVATVKALGLRTLIDLRTPKELARHGQAPAQLAPRRLHLPLIPDVWDMRPLDTAESLDAYFVERYLEMLELGAAAITETLGLLVDPDSYPVAVFCAAGKDRTGVMCAVLLRLIGVADQTIVADYVLSGPEVARLLADVGDSERWTAERMAGAAPRLLSAPAAVMQSFLAELPDADRLGGRYGLSASGRAGLRELLLDRHDGAGGL